MSPVSKGFVGLVFWLVMGFGLTEMTALMLNAYFFHETTTGRSAETTQAIQAAPDSQQQEPWKQQLYKREPPK